ncbi:hypothetical protein EX895_005045 [Sporisorium graminicola]|uniref:Uncharacterized protein n=1 Tax=Sporisorium graminicola TaxID=280036 RepID=A0A4U7KPE1_9BASI|nr:hypothetical protein EX895_005045 [Sporisorium graminicola]TKY86220.1 hypothetical protein EX895_005045 [Sporisorium graminicola]
MTTTSVCAAPTVPAIEQAAKEAAGEISDAGKAVDVDEFAERLSSLRINTGSSRRPVTEDEFRLLAPSARRAPASDERKLVWPPRFRDVDSEEPEHIVRQRRQ